VLLLALDNAEAACSVALWDDARPAAEAVIGYRRLCAARGQADHLIGLIDELLREAGCAYSALGALAVNCGPGSFTGLRSVVAAARGLALAAGLPVVGVTSFEALAAAVPTAADGTLAAALDARRGQLYLQLFDRDRQPRSAPAVVMPAQAVAALGPGPVRLVGSGAPLLRTALPTGRSARIESAELDARWVACCAARCLAQGARPQPGHTLRPLYLRPPDARPPAPRAGVAQALAVGA
jgi:tRNA threonylcarbamoyladenosine biosynthesis protein TsaB